AEDEAMTGDLGNLFAGIGHVAVEVAMALGPLLGLALVAQFTALRMRWRRWLQVGLGFVVSGVGLVLFLQGVNVTYVPLGEAIGRALAGHGRVWLLAVGLLLGVVATVAEPAVRILQDEAEKVSAGAIPGRLLLLAVAGGVGVSVALALVRTLTGMPIWYMLLPGYAGALILARYVHRDFVAIAFDSGAVATGPMIVSFIVALGLGVASALPGRDPLLDGLGLVSLVALAPILSVLAFGAILRQKERADDESGKRRSRHEPGL
ncbi:MAG TPA: DUF1538 domain-containing protein, partial [Bacillota bacterium]